MDTTAQGKIIDINRVMQMIPHRYPFLMVDRVVNVVPNVSAVGIKNVSINEPYFQGHFPVYPIMPGVLIIETMAQTAAVLVVETLGEEQARDKLVYFMSVESARFRKPVIPGDRLFLNVFKERSRGNVWKFRAEAKVEEILVADATYVAMITER